MQILIQSARAAIRKYDKLGEFDINFLVVLKVQKSKIICHVCFLAVPLFVICSRLHCCCFFTYLPGRSAVGVEEGQMWASLLQHHLTLAVS